MQIVEDDVARALAHQTACRDDAHLQGGTSVKSLESDVVRAAVTQAGEQRRGVLPDRRVVPGSLLSTQYTASGSDLMSAAGSVRSSRW